MSALENLARLVEGMHPRLDDDDDSCAGSTDSEISVRPEAVLYDVLANPNATEAEVYQAMRELMIGYWGCTFISPEGQSEMAGINLQTIVDSGKIFEERTDVVARMYKGLVAYLEQENFDTVEIEAENNNKEGWTAWRAAKRDLLVKKMERLDQKERDARIAQFFQFFNKSKYNAMASTTPGFASAYTELLDHRSFMRKELKQALHKKKNKKAAQLAVEIQAELDRVSAFIPQIEKLAYELKRIEVQNEKGSKMLSEMNCQVVVTLSTLLELSSDKFFPEWWRERILPPQS